MSKLNERIIEEFKAARLFDNHEHLCNAPFSNMYFAIDGRVGACWLTFYEAPTWPEHSIHDIWFGPFFSRLRESIQRCDLDGHGGCAVCKKNLESGNYISTLAYAYDTKAPVGKYPTIMELELSNKCNLECVMCRGELSSSIRKNREKKPPLPIPYDHRFVDQLEEFIPHLSELRCNGGEPLLHDILYDLWEKVAEINPEIEITIATNGTVLNKRVKEILERCRFRINVSIDALDRENFEHIRKNARYDVVMKNVEYFAEYCERKGSIFSIMINPLRSNWWEMPNLVEWCNEKGYHLGFNTIVKPAELSLISWSAEELEKVYRQLSSHEFPPHEGAGSRRTQIGNVRKYENLVENQVREWWESSKKGEGFFNRSYSD